jgi:hypothetical protein
MVSYLFEFQPAVRNNILSRIQVDILVHRAEGATDHNPAAMTVCLTKRRSHDALCARHSDSIRCVLARADLYRFYPISIFTNLKKRTEVNEMVLTFPEGLNFLCHHEL